MGLEEPPLEFVKGHVGIGCLELFVCIDNECLALVVSLGNRHETSRRERLPPKYFQGQDCHSGNWPHGRESDHRGRWGRGLGNWPWCRSHRRPDLDRGGFDDRLRLPLLAAGVKPPEAAERPSVDRLLDLS